MKLWQAILDNVSKKYNKEIITGADVELLFEKECYIVLEWIKAILNDETLDDKECFEKIEKIVCLIEEIGSGGGTRHDFG